MTDELPHRLGRLVQHDPRSRGYPVRAAAAPRPLVSKTWRRYGSTLNQGELGACTGYAMTHGLNTTPLRAAGPTHTHTTAVNLYSEATALDMFPGVYPPVDTGSSGLAVCKAAQARRGRRGRYERGSSSRPTGGRSAYNRPCKRCSTAPCWSGPCGPSACSTPTAPAW